LNQLPKLEINQIIKELLQLHDCVIYPNLGGFVAQYSPANFDKKKSVFSPPHKQILFNKNLVNNDGLLVNAFAQKNNISYENATESLTDFLLEINENLKTQNQHEFQGIGILYDNEGVLNFKQKSNNLLPSSYGLMPLNIDEFKMPNKSEKVIDLNPSKYLKTQIKNWALAASVILVVFYSAWIPIQTQLLKQGGEFNYSDLNPFTFKKDNLVAINDVKLHQPKKEIKAIQPIDKNSENSNSIISKSELKNNLKPNVIKSNQSGNKIFEVVIGSFTKEINAKNMIYKLQDKGISARKLKKENKLFRVSIGKFLNKNNAKKLQKSIRQRHKISSWILTK
jgi:cell division septation protein DedD